MPTSLTPRAFQQVDVFTDTPYYGNALAVVLDGTGLTDAQMQRFAQWTNLSETTFLLPPSATGQQGGADYQVRIFTTTGELPFAGHPTLGSCHAWLEAGGVPRAGGDTIVQECKVGLVTLRRDSDSGRLAFAAPPLRRSAPTADILAQVTAALGLTPAQVVAAQVLDNGPTWFGLLLDSPETVLQVQPDGAALNGLVEGVGIASIHSAGPRDGADLEVRFFASFLGVSEDPVTGSFNASLAQWLIADGHAPRQYVARQGTCIGRDGRVFINQDASGQVWVGGDTVSCIRGMAAI